MEQSNPRYCKKCKRDFYLGDKVYVNGPIWLCDNCIKDLLQDMVIDKQDDVAEAVGFDILEKYDPRNDT